MTHTRVVHKARAPPFEASIKLFSLTLMKMKVEQYLNAYILALDAEGQDVDEYGLPVSQSDLDEQHYGAKKVADAALTHLQAMFCDRPNFNNAKEAKIMLDRAGPDSDSMVLMDLIGWLTDIYNQLELDPLLSTKTIRSLSLVQLANLVKPFVSPMGDPNIDGTTLRCYLWPCVEAVHVRLGAECLQHGTVLVDTPGLGDVDPTRSDQLRRRLASCQATIVVASIERVVSNNAVHAEILDAHRRRKSDGVILSIADDTAAINDATEDDDFTRHQQMKSAIKSLEGKLAELEQDQKGIGQYLPLGCYKFKGDGEPTTLRYPMPKRKRCSRNMRAMNGGLPIQLGIISLSSLAIESGSEQRMRLAAESKCDQWEKAQLHDIQGDIKVQSLYPGAFTVVTVITSVEECQMLLLLL
ncbi:hypothetical protein CC80DRAFT_565120 [Byssothecium circinans]|uniref:Uncharacterized protein n=1 Tax=Byssothecium circinans TaxID=147558 RepID=A0A6A5UFW1_9PLEO|nr:hypothetical protein CC80DRAFT_565120 [Byssothecium circinans]